MADSDDKRDNLEEDVDQIVDENPDVEASGEGGAEGAAEGASGEDLSTLLEAALAEVAALKDQALRSQAEAENTRRRAARDVENAHKFALEKFAADLLPVVDSLEKGIEAAAVETSGAEGSKANSEGLELSLKLFLDVLEKSGVSRIHPLGEPFDPQHHEAMAMVENPDAEPNSVIDVMQPGYTLNGRLVRAAMVVVSKAPA
ncbi:MAG: nucleotide exchange factor GrpE [Pseudomonadota bacterium]